jgi:large subunit ribosomal protein L25
MEKVTIEAKVRQENESVKKIRKEGKIPAIVYGKETKTVPIEIKIKDIEKTVKSLKEGLLLITLKLIDNAEEKTVVIQEIQRDPVSDNIIHADFRQISLKEKSVFKVPVVTVGIPEGVKVGGVLEHILREIPVKCLPDNLPSKIELDVSNLKIGQDIKVRDIKLQEGIEIIEDKDRVVLTVIAPHKEEAAKPEAALAAAPTEPELIRKERAVEEGEDTKEGKEAKEATKEPAKAKEEKTTKPEKEGKK